MHFVLIDLKNLLISIDYTWRRKHSIH